MWPDDSGFEADVNSPAGMLQTEAAFARGIGRFRYGKVLVWLLLVLIVVVPIVVTVITLTRH